MTVHDPLAQFLGLDADAGPLEILGLVGAVVSDQSVIVARDRQLRSIDDNPLASTPDADEARLAVHAAAAQLLNSAIRARLVGAGRRSPQPSERAAQPSIKAPSGAAASLERDALLLLGLSGGWSPRVLSRLAALAIYRGLDVSNAVEAVRRLGRRPAANRPIPTRAARQVRQTVGSAPIAQSSARPDDDDPGSDEQLLIEWLKLGGAIAASAGISIAILGIGAYFAWNSLSSAQTSQPSPLVGAPGQAGVVADPNRISPRRDDPHNADLIALELRSAARLLKDRQPAPALERATTALDAWLDRWPNESTQWWTEIAEATRVFSSGLDGDAELSALFGAGLGGLIETEDGSATPVRRLIGLAGVAGVLRQAPADRDSEVLEPVLTGLETAGVSTSGQHGFIASARFAAGELPVLLGATEPAESWEQWGRATIALCTAAGEPPSADLRRGLTELLSRLGSPSASERRAIETLTPLLDWRSGSTSRRWLINRFTDRSIETERLSVLVGTLARGSSAPGVLTTMVLSPDSSWVDRAALADTFADARRLPRRVVDDTFVEEWLRRADEFLDSPTPQGDAARLERLARLARLNASSQLARLGLDDEAISTLGRSIGAGIPPRATDLFPAIADDGRWTVQYEDAARDADRRVALLGAWLQPRRQLGPIDAATLVRETFRGSNRTIRDAAVTSFKHHADANYLILATLEFTRSIPDTPESRELLSFAAGAELGDDDRRPFVDRARVALSRRLADRGRSGALATIDDLADAVLDAYLEAAAPLGGEIAQTENLAAVARTLTDARLAGVTRSEDAGLIIARRVAARRLARGPIQTFVIEQRALAQSTALAISGNLPHLERPTTALLERMEEQLGSASEALEQAVILEASLARLNALELSTEAGP